MRRRKIQRDNRRERERENELNQLAANHDCKSIGERTREYMTEAKEIFLYCCFFCQEEGGSSVIDVSCILLCVHGF